MGKWREILDMIAFGFISKMNDRSENSRTLLILLPLLACESSFLSPCPCVSLPNSPLLYFSLVHRDLLIYPLQYKDKQRWLSYLQAVFPRRSPTCTKSLS